MVGRNRDDDALVHRALELGFEKVANFASTLADQARDHDIRFSARDHLAHQHGFADARTRDDGDPLPPPGGQQRIDGAHAEVKRLSHAPAIQHIALNAVQRPASARSEEHTSELQSLMRISYAVFCLKKKKTSK